MNQVCSVCRPSCPCDKCVSAAKAKLTHGADGPITDFVIISRGCRLANRGFTAEVIANAIAESLEDYGFLPKENPVLQTGS
jgi:hypothetical protein